MGATIANNQVYGENLTQARSRVRDVEMAEQSSEMTKARIMNQLQTSLLSHTAVDGSLALKLLA